jgi:hypothetical protein
VLQFDPFVDAINERLRHLIDGGAGLVVFFTRLDGEECEWRRDIYCTRIARYARAGVVVTRYVDDRRAGPAEAVGMDFGGIADTTAMVLEHVANPAPERAYVPIRGRTAGDSAG